MQIEGPGRKYLRKHSQVSHDRAIRFLWFSRPDQPTTNLIRGVVVQLTPQWRFSKEACTVRTTDLRDHVQGHYFRSPEFSRSLASGALRSQEVPTVICHRLAASPPGVFPTTWALCMTRPQPTGMFGTNFIEKSDYL